MTSPNQTSDSCSAKQELELVSPIGYPVKAVTPRGEWEVAIGTKGEKGREIWQKKTILAASPWFYSCVVRKFNKALTVAYKEARLPLSAMLRKVVGIFSWNVD